MKTTFIGSYAWQSELTTGMISLTSMRGVAGTDMRGELKPVQKRTLTQEAFDQLVAYIQDGTLQPGDALPSQQELARQLSVSRPVLREAMQRLEAAGLIE